jgi:hypothetical protein
MLDIAQSIARASADINAIVHFNGVLSHGVVIQNIPGGFTVSMGSQSLMSQTDIDRNEVTRPLTEVFDAFMSHGEDMSLADRVGVTTVSPHLDHYINLLIVENPESFAYNKGLWKITMDFWFGDAEVSLNSFFVSHKVPVAWATARAMAKASGRLRGGTLTPPTSWAVNVSRD